MTFDAFISDLIQLTEDRKLIFSRYSEVLALFVIGASVKKAASVLLEKQTARQ